ncbi:hypothetical protein [Campylobacter taeniopygiae]|uniref:Uncharacterized protein n=1 Tax=Campylobacter taeniopygiae TaxID=2510188 RepID=A0ABY2TJE9_9BACT|nr:hypothetical protein [Campylobacter taeniopygiae]TKX34229.1 hypothetical protein CQA75_03795 [Campylobacter taeniopygiae]
MQKILQIDLEKRKALENLKNLGLVGLGGTMLFNLKEQPLVFNQELTYVNTYNKYLNLDINSFYIPSVLMSLLQLTKKTQDIFYINVLINSDTHYKNPLLQYTITQKQEHKNIVYALKNDESFNTFHTLNDLKLALEEKNFYLNFLDLNNKESLMSFYNFLLKDKNLKFYFYFKDQRFYISKKNLRELQVNTDLDSKMSLELYLKLLNDFKVLNKFELIEILEALAQNNIKALYLNKKFTFSPFLINLRVK